MRRTALIGGVVGHDGPRRGEGTRRPRQRHLTPQFRARVHGSSCPSAHVLCPPPPLPRPQPWLIGPAGTVMKLHTNTSIRPWTYRPLSSGSRGQERGFPVVRAEMSPHTCAPVVVVSCFNRDFGVHPRMPACTQYMCAGTSRSGDPGAIDGSHAIRFRQQGGGRWRRGRCRACRGPCFMCALARVCPVLGRLLKHWRGDVGVGLGVDVSHALRGPPLRSACMNACRRARALRQLHLLRSHAVCHLWGPGGARARVHSLSHCHPTLQGGGRPTGREGQGPEHGERGRSATPVPCHPSTSQRASPRKRQSTGGNPPP